MRPAGAAEHFDVSVVLQKDTNGYAAASDDATSPAVRLIKARQGEPYPLDDPADASDGAYFLRVDGLGEQIRGQRAKINSASLWLYYIDESWTTAKYTLALHASADGTRGNFEEKAAATVFVYGDRCPKTQRTPLGEFVEWKLPPEMVQKWLEQPKSNKGLVLRVARISDTSSADENAEPADDFVRAAELYFCSNAHPDPALRPRLTVSYSFEGNAPPARPVMDFTGSGAPIAHGALLKWQMPEPVDVNGDAITYEVQFNTQRSDAGWRKAASGLAEPSHSVSLKDIEQGLSVRFRVRAVDEHGLPGGWAEAGSFTVRDNELLAWVVGLDEEIRPRTEPNAEATEASMRALRNETESFQVAVWGAGELMDVRVEFPQLKTDAGAALRAGSVLGYRQLYVNANLPSGSIGTAGLTPDPLVPLVHPGTGEPTTAMPFDVASFENQLLWFDVRVPVDAAAGTYSGILTVTANVLREKEPEDASAPALDADSDKEVEAAGEPFEVVELKQTIRVALEVLPFTLPEDGFPPAAFLCSREQVALGHGIAADDPQLTGLMELYDAQLAGHHLQNWWPGAWDQAAHEAGVKTDGDRRDV